MHLSHTTTPTALPQHSYLCLCCICISIFTDTVTSGCCQHLACLSPLTSPSWQRLHIPTCYWSIIFAYLPRSGALLYNHTRWWVNIWKKYFGEFLRWKIDIREEHWMSNKSIMWSIAEKVNVKKINNATNHPLFHKIKHRKNCECCPLPRLIVRSQWYELSEL